ncbi:MAG: hypothetical protein JXB33_08790, partial [Clostridia bacterium]|nr:hypothetical protein [Clostridia bacterium]
MYLGLRGRPVDGHGIMILRDYAKRKLEYASSKGNPDKMKRWYRHNEIKGEPMVIGGPYGKIQTGKLRRRAELTRR